MEAYKEPLASTARHLLCSWKITNGTQNHLVGCGGYFHMAQARNAFTEMLPSVAQYLDHYSKTKIHIAQDP